jgi:hypothetical protein
MPDPIDVSRLIGVFNQLQRRGVKYFYGAKANDKSHNPRSSGRLSTPPDTIDELDCSGFTRYALYQAAGWTIPDGSENQLDWYRNQGFERLASYSQVNRNNGRGLYIAFIKADTNGAGHIGHVWFVYKQRDEIPAETLECHGGGGIGSRPWNTAGLSHEEYMAFELPIVSTAGAPDVGD